ncbi:MAG: carboxypeptidase M32 [Pseudomonadota bacterium]
MTDAAYDELKAKFKRIAAIGDAAGVLHWDMAVTMPAGAAPGRAEQLATLKLLSHETLTDPRLGELMAKTDADALQPWDRANLREMKRSRAHAAAAPAKLVEALSKASSACEMTWREARPANDFAAVKPLLTEVLKLTRELAQAKGEALKLSPYDALLDQYEPGGRAEKIDALFTELERELPPLLFAAIDRQDANPPPPKPKGPFPQDVQKAVGERFMQAAGFDFKRGRLDVSHHPFCGGATGDIRITTRYDQDDFASALMGVLHETGHALYDLGLPQSWRGQPVGEARGMVLHESQSLLLEMQACRSEDFLSWAAPILRRAFGGKASDPAWKVEALYANAIRVERGFIRVDADEVTYPAHVLLRYRLERSLIGGDLKVDDLPGAWMDGFEKLMGVRPPDDRRGCLQDIHWFDGAFGYFPTYTLGAIAAAQIFAAAKAAVPEIPQSLRKGDFKPLMTWLRTKIHRAASSGSTDGILKSATGETLNVKPFLSHLRARYL